MTYDEFLSRYNEAAASVRADFANLTAAQRRAPRGRSERIRLIRSENMGLASTGALSLSRVGLTVDEARDLARAGLVNLYPDRFRKLEAIAPRKAAS